MNKSFLTCSLSVLPIPLTIAWLTVKAYEQDTDMSYCDTGYNLMPSYWILEGPRIAAIMVSLIIVKFGLA